MNHTPLLGRLVAAALLLGVLSVAPVAAQTSTIATNLSCATNSSGNPTVANGHIAWPADNPVWEFDFYRPANRSTSNSQGLEIRNVTYRGRKVIERAGVPVLNVEYDPGASCNCYRDWMYTEARMDTDNVFSGSCYAEAQAVPVLTTCELPTGGDAGTFRGVAVEDFGDELVLTSNTSAGWYRYRMKWHFYADGRIWPEYSFSAASATCTTAAHRHHAYWRFDFDLEDTPTNDEVSEVTAAGATTVFTAEADRTWGNPADGIYWRVRDETADVGFTIEPSAADLELPVDAFSKTDALVLRYKATEIDDGIGLGGGCAFLYDTRNWVNGEAVTNQDIVFWYRSSALHAAGNPWECDIVGPTLRPFGYSTVSGEAPAMDASGLEIDTAIPNPFSPSTTVRFRVAETQAVRVTLYDALGRQVQTLFDGLAQGGHYESVQIRGAGLPSGTYVVRVDGASVQGTTRVVLQR